MSCREAGVRQLRASDGWRQHRGGPRASRRGAILWGTGGGATETLRVHHCGSTAPGPIQSALFHPEGDLLRSDVLNEETDASDGEVADVSGEEEVVGVLPSDLLLVHNGIRALMGHAGVGNGALKQTGDPAILAHRQDNDFSHASSFPSGVAHGAAEAKLPQPIA